MAKAGSIRVASNKGNKSPVMTIKDTENNKPASKLNFFQIVISVLAAAVGVQSSRNRERDFSGNNLLIYIAAGLIFAALFITGLVFWVQHLLASS